MSSYPEHTVQLTSLKDLGYFAKISFGEMKKTEGSIGNGLQETKIIFVVDRSGSMGQHFPAVIKNVIPTTLLSLGFPASFLVDIVTFDSYLDSTSTSIEALMKDSRTARGSTYMAEVFEKLCNMIQKAGSDCPVTVVVISDGEIMDKPQTLTEASRVSAKLSRAAPVSVIPIRLLTSASANPDTQALAAVALFNSAGPVPLIEHCVFVDKENAYSSLSKELATLLRKSVSSYGSVVAGKAILRSVPQATGQSKVSLASTVNFVLIDAGADLSSIQVNGKPLIDASSGVNSDIQVLESEKEIQPFLEFILSWLKVRMVVGKTDAHFQAVIAWFQRLQAIMDDASATNDSSSSNVLLRDRIAFVKKILKKRSVSLMNEVLQFANASRLDNLNSNQLADYLRSNVKSKATARRMENFQESSGMSWKEHAQGLLKKLSVAYNKLHGNEDNSESPAETSEEVVDEVANGIISFFSQATAEDCLFAARDFLEESDAENVEIFDLLQLSGGLGLCFNAVRTDLPDPWQYKVKDVFMGNYFLSEADIRTSQDVAIPYPGTGAGREDNMVTGVLPLMKLNKRLYDMYHFGELKLLSELQAGVTMRGVLGVIPYDVLAMNAAVLFKIMSSIPVREKATAFQIEMIDALKEQIIAHINRYAKNSFAGIAKALTNESDPRIFLIGANDANAVLKLFCILVGHEVCQGTEMIPEQLCKVIAILYDLAAYTAAKHHFRRAEYLLANPVVGADPQQPMPKNRQEALMELLQLDLTEFRANSDVGKAFEPDPEFSPSVEVNVEACVEKLPEWVPNISKFASIYRWLRQSPMIAEEPLTAAYEAFGFQSSRELHMFKLWVAANATFCGDEDARIDKEQGMAKTCLPNDIPNVVTELQTMVDKICKRDFDNRLAQKRAQESSLALESLLTDLLQCETEEEFITLLNAGNHYNLVTIRDRSSNGYEALMEQLTNGGIATKGELTEETGVVIRLRFKKLAILLTGRIVTTGQVVWNNGNVYRQYLLPFTKLFTQAGKADFWAQIATCISENTKHTYRVGLRNRHRHGDDKPSYYAFGFQTLANFEEACKNNVGCYSMKDWNDYVALHTNCCGFRVKFGKR